MSWEHVKLRPVPYPQDPSVEINEPVEPIVIESIRVETFGETYPMPVKREMKRRPPSW